MYNNMNEFYKHSNGPPPKKSKTQKNTYSMIPFIKSWKAGKTNLSCLGINDSVVKSKKWQESIVIKARSMLPRVGVGVLGMVGGAASGCQ